MAGTITKGGDNSLGNTDQKALLKLGIAQGEDNAGSSSWHHWNWKLIWQIKINFTVVQFAYTCVPTFSRVLAGPNSHHSCYPTQKISCANQIISWAKQPSFMLPHAEDKLPQPEYKLGQAAIIHVTPHRISCPNQSISCTKRPSFLHQSFMLPQREYKLCQTVIIRAAIWIIMTGGNQSTVHK